MHLKIIEDLIKTIKIDFFYWNKYYALCIFFIIFYNVILELDLLFLIKKIMQYVQSLLKLISFRLKCIIFKYLYKAKSFKILINYIIYYILCIYLPIDIIELQLELIENSENNNNIDKSKIIIAVVVIVCVIIYYIYVNPTIPSEPCDAPTEVHNPILSQHW